MGTLPGFFARANFELFARLFIALKNEWLLLIIAALICGSSLLSLFLFINVFELNLVGIVISINIAFTLGFLVSLGLIFLLPSLRELRLFHFSKQSFSEYVPIWKTNILALLFGIFGLLFGYVELAAQSILIRYTFVILGIAAGFFTSSITNMGYAYGRNDRALMFIIYKASIILFVIMVVIATAFNIILRYPLAELTTSEESVIDLAANLTPLVAIANDLAVLYLLTSLPLLTTSRVLVTTIFSFIANIIVGFPIAIVLTLYTNFSIAGFWWAAIILSLFENVSLLVANIVYYRDIFGQPEEQKSEMSKLIEYEYGCGEADDRVDRNRQNS
jgi:Na+-driven multidrug efflux pump